MESSVSLVEAKKYNNAWHTLLDQAQDVQSYAEFASLYQWRQTTCESYSKSSDYVRSVKGGAFRRSHDAK